MKYPVHSYAKALALVIAASKESDADKIVANFLALVERNGDSMHLPKILADAGEIVRKKDGIRKIVLESARPQTSAQRKMAAEFINKGDVVEERIDPALIAGLRIIIDDERQFDGSLKGKLDKMLGTA